MMSTLATDFSRFRIRAVAMAAVAASIWLSSIGAQSRAATIVNDTWQDGNFNQPPTTVTVPFTTAYSEFGTDQDGDGDIESWWAGQTSGAVSAATGHLTLTNNASSSSFTTLFTPAGSEINLASPGDQLKITWSFTPNGVNSASTAQGFRLAVVNWPELSGGTGLNRLTSQTAPGTPAAGATYHGYALFGNMRTALLGNSNAFQLLKRADTDASPQAFLSASGAWTATGLTNSTTNNASTPGYTDLAPLTFVMTFTHNASNGIDVTATMTGAGLGAGNQGFLFQSATDATPNGFLFDTFGIRPSTNADTASSFDTTNFKVEFIPVPEPSALVSLAAIGILSRRRRAAQRI
jgi:hypothetical protein